jgi:glycine betaine/proline transport system substrate-binding protein
MAIKRTAFSYFAFGLLSASILAIGLSGPQSSAASAKPLPGEGKVLTPGFEGALETLMLTFVAMEGVKRLGYQVKDDLLVRPAIKYVALARGDIDFLADGWVPTQKTMYDAANRAGNLVLLGPMVAGTTAGYFVDIKTKQKHKLTNVEQLKDPNIAKLFDIDGSGKAALYGCPQGWGCERRIEFQIDAYGLRPTVRQVSGELALLSADLIRRYRDGKPVLFFTYFPQWLGQVLIPGTDIDLLEVPFTALPPGTEGKTVLEDGRNIGHPRNNIYFVAKKEFLAENPSIQKLFELVRIPVEDVTAQNYKIYLGEKSRADILRHSLEWISKNQQQFDRWVAEAIAVGK